MGRLPKTPVFEEFSRLANCWDFSNQPTNLEQIFPITKKLMIELGAGTCYFSTGFAAKHHDWNVLATDLKRDRLWKGAKRASNLKLNNIAFLNIDVAKLSEIVGDNRVDELWLTFPDPYSKARQAKHRMNQPEFLSQYSKLLQPDGRFNLKTDDPHFFIECVDNLKKAKWQIEELVTDLHHDVSDSSDRKIKTRYESEFIEAGLPIFYLRAKK